MRQYLEKLSDTSIREEYIRRYTLLAGARLPGSKETADHLRGFYAESKYKESFVMICLNAQHEIIETKLLFTGTIATAAVYPRELVKSILLEYPATVAVIISHNHPSGRSLPSSSDYAITKKIKVALESVDINLLDHIIVGNEYYSFADNHNL
jgi:DNA repair protein RadC